MIVLSPDENDVLIDGIMMFAAQGPSADERMEAAALLDKLAAISGVTVSNVEEFPHKIRIAIERRTGEHRSLSDRHNGIVLGALQMAWIFAHPERMKALDMLERIAVVSGLEDTDFRPDYRTDDDTYVQLARAVNIIVEPVLEGQEPRTH